MPDFPTYGQHQLPGDIEEPITRYSGHIIAKLFAEALHLFDIEAVRGKLLKLSVQITSVVHALAGTSRRAVIILRSKSLIDDATNMVRAVRMMAKINEYQKASMTMRSTPMFLFARK